MAKNVFRPGEIKPVEDTVILKLSHNYAPVVEEEVIEEVPEYTGPTADDLRREAECGAAGFPGGGSAGKMRGTRVEVAYCGHGGGAGYRQCRGNAFCAVGEKVPAAEG